MFLELVLFQFFMFVILVFFSLILLDLERLLVFLDFRLYKLFILNFSIGLGATSGLSGAPPAAALPHSGFGYQDC